jgi:alpha-ketoglutarate-dependent 2,4-dichlorophenoxyacetate dioxygenase
VVEHSIATSRRKSGFDSFNGDIATTLPPVPQRLVDHYPDSGRSSLFLASHASHVIGWPVGEGEALLAELIEFATQDRFVYTQNWQVGDLVVWDNRCTMHRGRPYDPAHRRVLHRTTVSDVETPYEKPVAVDAESAADSAA